MVPFRFHVDAVNLLHQADGIGIDPGLGFRSCGIAFKHIGCQTPSQRFRDLAAAGIVDADKRYLLHTLTPANDCPILTSEKLSLYT